MAQLYQLAPSESTSTPISFTVSTGNMYIPAMLICCLYIKCCHLVVADQSHLVLFRFSISLFDMLSMEIDTQCRVLHWLPNNILYQQMTVWINNSLDFIYIYNIIIYTYIYIYIYIYMHTIIYTIITYTCNDGIILNKYYKLVYTVNYNEE